MEQKHEKRKPNPDKVHFKHFYENSGKRVTTIAFKFEKRGKYESAKVTYGAAQFRKLNERETWQRKSHNSTAKARLERCPVTVFVESDITFPELEEKLRKYLFKFGVKSLRSGDLEGCRNISACGDDEVFRGLLRISRENGGQKMETLFKPDNGINRYYYHF